MQLDISYTKEMVVPNYPSGHGLFLMQHIQFWPGKKVEIYIIS